MKATEQTLQQAERAIRKTIEKFPSTEEATLLTDIHLRVSQDTGELMSFDDDDNEITRCVVEQWIDNKDDNFYQEVAATLRTILLKQKEKIEQMSILKPFSFVLEDDGLSGQVAERLICFSKGLRLLFWLTAHQSV